MRKKSLPILLVPLLLCLAIGCQAQANDTMAVFCWSLTPQTKDVVRGVERVLGRTLPVTDAGENYANGESLIKQLAHKRLRLLLVLGTQTLRLTAPAVKKGLTVFAMVADPYQTGAAYNSAHPDDHQENITGIASPPPLEEAIRQTKKLFPARRQWGLLYNPAEGPSVELEQNFVTLAKAAGLDLTVLAARSGPEAVAALQELKKKGVQVVFIPPDQFSQKLCPAPSDLGPGAPICRDQWQSPDRLPRRGPHRHSKLRGPGGADRPPDPTAAQR